MSERVPEVGISLRQVENGGWVASYDDRGTQVEVWGPTMTIAAERAAKYVVYVDRGRDDCGHPSR